ncbi:MAG: ABC transporter ATP-binding protein [Roseiflexaceae bacterium]
MMTIDNGQRTTDVPAVPAVRIAAVTRSYAVGGERVAALRGVDLLVPQGAFIALMGRSGSGKTTLLNVIGGLDQPTTGEVALYGQQLNGLSQERLTLLRRAQIGFIFQSFALLPMLSAWENVEMPLRIAGVRAARERRARAAAALALVGLERWSSHRPAEMSGGQQQRVAIARALVARPRLLLADEPTGELDSTTGRAVLQLLRGIVQTEGLTLIIATHDQTVREFADVVYRVVDGQVGLENS